MTTDTELTAHVLLIIALVAVIAMAAGMIAKVIIDDVLGSDSEED